MDNSNRREFFRVYFNEPMDGEIVVDEETIPINIVNMSAGGVGFVTPRDLSEEANVNVSFSILEKPFQIAGHIKRKLNKSTFEYGVEFEMDLKTSSELFQHLNFYVIRNRK